MAIGNIHLLQHTMTVQTIPRSGQTPLSLRRAGFRVHLAYCQVPFFQSIDYGFLRHLVPLDSDILRRRYHISLVGIDLLQHIGGIPGYEHILECGDTLAVRLSVQLHPISGKRCAGQAECVPL